MSTQSTTLSLGTDSIPRLLARYAVPAIIAMASSSLYNIIDSIFVGHGVGGAAIAGMAITMPVMNIAAAFGSMVGVGAASRMSIRLGEGNRLAAENTLGNAVLLNLVLGVVVMVGMLLFLDPILQLFSGGRANAQTLGYARDFMQVIMLGNVVTHLYLSLNEQIRASGYPQRSMAIMLTAVCVNLVLNPLFIFVFHWGIRGSAWATVTAQTVALAMTLVHFSSRGSFICFRRGIFRPRWSILSAILSIGLAPFLVNLCASLVAAFVNGALLRFGGHGTWDAVQSTVSLGGQSVGDIYVGAYGITNRVVMLFIMIVAGLNQGMQPIVGYNYGARKYDRVRRTLRLTIVCGVCITTVGFLIGQLLPTTVAHLFVDARGGAVEQAMIVAATQAMHIALAVFPFVGFQVVTGNFFQYIGKAPYAIFLSLTRQLLFLLPLLSVLPRLYGATGVWISLPTADFTATVVAAVLLVRELRRLRAQERAQDAGLLERTHF